MDINPLSKKKLIVLKSEGTSDIKCKDPCVETLIKNHLGSESEKKLFKCDFPGCHKTLANAKRLKIHSRSHNNMKSFVCSFCKKIFTEKGNLKTHLRIHTGERPFKCDYPECKANYKTKSHLNDHINSKHLNKRPFVCETCGKCFSRNSQLKTHSVIHIKNSAVDIFKIKTAIPNKSNSNNQGGISYTNVYYNKYNYNQFNDKQTPNNNSIILNILASEKKFIQNFSHKTDLEVTSPDIYSKNKQGFFEQLSKTCFVNTSDTTINKDIKIGLEAEAVHKQIKNKVPDLNCVGFNMNSHRNNFINDYGNYKDNDNKEFSPSIPPGACASAYADPDADSNADSFILNLQDYLYSKDPVFYLYDIDMIVTHDLYYDLNSFCDF